MSTKQLSLRRRHLVLGGAGASLLTPWVLRAQTKPQEIILGASMAVTGVFSFAGIGANNGIADYVKIINDAGGIAGLPVRYIAEDTGYKVDASVAVFKKLTSAYPLHLYYGDSTGFAKTINQELARRGDVLMAGASFATELNDPQRFPLQFMLGPDYGEQIAMLLRYIAREKPQAKIALVHSDSEFGRDPIAASEALAKQLGLNLVIKIMTPPGSVDVSTEVIRLRRAAPDYTIFHGYVAAPIPEFITQGKQQGMQSQWMGTFWTMDTTTVMRMGAVADGFMGVMPYRYYDDEAPAPMLEKLRTLRPDYQSVMYIHGVLVAMLLLESARRCLEANQPMTGANLKAALNSLKDFDTGGLIGVPITINGNSIPVGRIYRADMQAQKMRPVSDWIQL